MLVKRISPLTMQENVRDIPCTPEQFDNWQSGRMLIQNAMPDVSAEDREFLISGCTPEDWKALFG